MTFAISRSALSIDSTGALRLGMKKRQYHKAALLSCGFWTFSSMVHPIMVLNLATLSNATLKPCS